MNEQARTAIYAQVAARIARLGDQWRTAANYCASEKSAITLQAVAREALAADLLASDLCQDEDPARAASAAQTLLRSLYADELHSPELWASPVGRRIAWIMPIPGDSVPAKTAAALLDLTRQRVWQLVGLERLVGVDLDPEGETGRTEIDTVSLYRYYNPRGTLAGQPDQR